MSKASATGPSTATVALIGNPNTGKSTLFSALAGIHQKVGNYPGVTVEKKVGQTQVDGRRLTLIDLPGTYSLAPRSPDEMVAVDVLTGSREDQPAPHVVLCIVDATNLERNLYLVSQVLEMGLPTVLALNMIDLARSRGLTIDADKLASRLGLPVVEVQANKKQGLEKLKQTINSVLDQERPEQPSLFPPAFVEEVDALSTAMARSSGPGVPRYLVERLLLDTSGYLQEHMLLNDRESDLPAQVLGARDRLKQAGTPVPAIEAMVRYGWVSRVLEGVISRPETRPVTLSDRLDRVLTHRVWGTLIFGLLMVIMFQAMFSWSQIPSEWIDQGVSAVGSRVGSLLAEGPLRDLLVVGVIGGVGAVLVFLPQILFLFLFIAILEDCGYMARAAYLMDRLMVKLGLSGKSFIPLLSSFACAIPGVMATRVIENRRDRLTTMLIAPLMSCSARLPVYTLLIAAFIPARRFAGGLVNLQAVTMFAMYMVGIVTAAFVAWLLKRTLLKGGTPPFVMELPAYKWPSPSIVLQRMFSQGMGFVRRAGTMILAVSVLVWAAAYYPREQTAQVRAWVAEKVRVEKALASAPEDEASRDRLSEIEARIEGEHQRNSYLGQAGRWIEPAVRPLGWDWRIGSAAIASFPAREVVVATLGVLFEAGDEPENLGETSSFHSALQRATWPDTGKPLFNVPVALSLMVFFALCAQCAATLAVIRRETNSYRWPIFTFAYMTTLAYVGALIVYQVGMRIGS